MSAAIRTGATRRCSGPRPQLNNAQPLSLNLSYLLTAWCDKDFTSEQRAMSIALQAIHSQPIVTQNIIAADLLTRWLPNGEFVISIEADTIEEMSRLWQAFTVPMRLSALIRVGVVFVAPDGAARRRRRAACRRQSRRRSREPVDAADDAAAVCRRRPDPRRSAAHAVAADPTPDSRRSATQPRWPRSVAARWRSPATGSTWPLRPMCFSSVPGRRPNGT